ncbi:tyrosine-protein phosphatase, partial [Providencia rettgeri]|nr:tyrosine-protein phosphatase [Providencia rettgeri]
ESFIIEVFNTMEEISGSVKNYIKNELKFTNNDIKQLREIYLV